MTFKKGLRPVVVFLGGEGQEQGFRRRGGRFINGVEFNFSLGKRRDGFDVFY